MNKEFIETLKRKQLKIAFAESMTGGLLSSMLTDVPGASDVFELAIVCYSNEMKEKLLKISPEVIEKHGVVSKEVAEAMAINIKKLAHSDIGIGITGNAGPTALADSVVGQVWVGVVFLSEVYHFNFYFEDMERAKIKECAAENVFKVLAQLLRQKIIGEL